MVIAFGLFVGLVLLAACGVGLYRWWYERLLHDIVRMTLEHLLEAQKTVMAERAARRETDHA